MATHLMLDEETLSRTPGGVVFQIAATTFSPITGRIQDSFCMDIDVQDAVSEGLTICPDTEQWWKDQGGIQQHNPLPLRYVIQQFKDWLQTIEPDYLWSWGIDFDFPMLQHIFDLLEIETPWKYWTKRDARTVWALANPGVKHEGQRHDALTDCITQSKELSKAIHTLGLSPLSLV